MTHTITVAPAARGWLVSSTVSDNPMVFVSGAKAEAAARRLGETLAGLGERAEILVRLRDGSLAGRLLCGPEPRPLALAG